MLVALWVVPPQAARAQAPELQVDSEIATAGFYQLRWFADARVELEEARNEDFASPRLVYRGSDAARVVSGKPDGVFYYRVRDTGNGTFSNTVAVTVRHHSLVRAFAFFSVGAIVFLATLLLIASGVRSGDDAH